MRKLKNMKQKILAVLMSVMCLVMIAPFGIPAFAAPEENDSYAETLSTYDSDMIHEIADNGIYPDYLNYFKFDDPEREHESDFSYSTSDDVITEENMLDYSGSYVQFDIGFKTKVQSEDAFSIGKDANGNDPITLTEKNICQIGDDWVDLTLYITKISFGEHNDTYERWGPDGGPFAVGDYIVVGGVKSYKRSDNLGAFEFYSDYSAEVTFDWTVEMTYSETGEVVDVPFDLIVDDIDQVSSLEKSDGSPLFTESWTVPDSDYSRYDIYEDCELNITSANGYTTFAATEETNANTNQEEYAFTGFTGISNTGSFSGSTVCGRTTGSYLTFWCDYVLPGDPPIEKTVENAKDAYNAGDVLPFHCTAIMPAYMVDTYRTFGSMALLDEIQEGLTYVDGSARMYSGDADVTDTAGTLTYTDNGDGTETVRFDFNDAWLNDTSNYAGQELDLRVRCTVDEGYNGETLINREVYVIDDQEWTTGIDVPVTEPTLAITKTADKETYSVSDTVTYTIAVNQTYPGAVAPNTVVTDTVPSELALVDVVTDMGTATMDGNSFAVNVGDLWDTETATITVTATALEAADDIKNTAYASADYVSEVSDNAIISVRKPGLTIRKEADQEQYYPGETVTYTIRVQNMLEEDAASVYDDDMGDEDASGDASPASRIPTAYNVVVSDSLPDGLTLVSVVDDADGEIAIDGNSFTVSYPYMYCGDEYVLTVEATVDDDVGNTTLTNVATVLSDHTDPVSDDADIRVIKPNLSIEKTADRDTCDTGDTVTFTVTVNETAEDVTETNVVVTDPLPSGFTLSGTPRLSGVEGSVAADDNAVTVTIPRISYGESAVITVQATVDDGYEGETITNTAYVHGDHTDEINDDAAVSVNAPSVATPESTTPESTTPVKTGQAIGGVMAGIAAVIAISVLIVVVSRRRRI